MPKKDIASTEDVPLDRFNITLSLTVTRVEKDGELVPPEDQGFVRSVTAWDNTKIDSVMAIQTLLTKANEQLVELGLLQLDVSGFSDLSTILKGVLKS